MARIKNGGKLKQLWRELGGDANRQQSRRSSRHYKLSTVLYRSAGAPGIKGIAAINAMRDVMRTQR